ncbi:hypothetical protein LAUMK13_01518 [Mycobacterium innocens]|uniref:Uncharacterized protein n=1 Tax=Mycobacterium innocens TaxID=2341083 RepID=A0A498PY81_9MYCO|nr:hypothetical protein LAUMK13_01518 [Mycobacterium innocens]
MVFWAPIARPLQKRPATSGIAVNAKPLSSIVITDAATISATATVECR